MYICIDSCRKILFPESNVTLYFTIKTHTNIPWVFYISKTPPPRNVDHKLVELFYYTLPDVSNSSL